MLTEKDLAQVMQIVNDVKKELRAEFNDFSNRNHEDKTNMKSSSALTFVAAAENEMFDDVTVTEHSDMFLVWEPGVDYAVNNIRQYEQQLYKCLQAHTSQDDWTPDKTPALWKKVGDPAEEFPEWSQPIGAGDAYMTGDKVTYNDKHWQSTVDNNVWAPGVYGWVEV